MNLYQFYVDLETSHRVVRSYLHTLSWHHGQHGYLLLTKNHKPLKSAENLTQQILL